MVRQSVFVELCQKTKMAALNPNNLPMEIKCLHNPPLQDVADILNISLKSNFSEVNVEVVDCPDLSKPPFNLASSGLGGHPKIVEIGGNPYLLPVLHKEKIYELIDIAKMVNSDPAFIIGPGAGPFSYVGVNCEGIFNLKVSNRTVINQQTRISKVDQNDDKSIQETLPDTVTKIALLGNLLISEGVQGKVLKVHVKKRIGEDNFITSIRKSLENAYKDQLLGVGGTFLITEGKAKQHVMRNFPIRPIKTENDLNNWLKFYNMSAPLIALGTFVTGDGGLDLRIQHFHSFSTHGEAGHYHFDTTPDIVEYLGYFILGEEIYRIDKPVNTHAWGRD